MIDHPQSRQQDADALMVSHDLLFRTLIECVALAAELIRFFLPERVAAILSDDPPTPINGPFIGSDHRMRLADGVFRFLHRDDPSIPVYVLTEHKSSFTIRVLTQMLRYVASLWDYDQDRRGKDWPAKPPVIVPMVIYHGDGGWSLPESFPGMDRLAADGERPLGGWLGYVMRDLGEAKTMALIRDPVVRAVMKALKYGHGKKKVSKSELVVIFKPLPDHSKLETNTIKYVSGRCDNTPKEIEAALMEAKPTRWRELMVGTAAREWLNEGEAIGFVKGKAEGIAEGKAKGKAETLLRQLEQRFGAVPDSDKARVHGASLEEVDRWLARIVAASSLSDVFAPEN